MADLWNDLLHQQYEASLATLNHCLENGPDGAWQGKVVNLTFDQAVFHTLFFTDYYLGKTPDDLKQQAYHRQHADFFGDYEEMEPRVQVQRYRKESLRDYLQFCRTKAKETLAAESAADLAAPCAFPPKDFSRAELHFYNVRHIQHHAAQLIMRLRLDYQVHTPWFGSGWPG
ncbi:DinB family protein [Bremerella sp. JC770]|uniref:DinB family protein n=1 Tax=Bremerella sp. JC770 TaxID=3232137 RepID=UPI0034574E46